MYSHRSLTMNDGRTVTVALPPFTLAFTVVQVARADKGLTPTHKLVCRMKTPADDDPFKVIAELNSNALTKKFNWQTTGWVNNLATPGKAVQQWWTGVLEFPKNGPARLRARKGDPMEEAYSLARLADVTELFPSGTTAVEFLTDEV